MKKTLEFLSCWTNSKELSAVLVLEPEVAVRGHVAFLPIVEFAKFHDWEERQIIWLFLDDGPGQTLQVVQKTSSLAALAECTENLRLRELKLFFFEFHAWYYWLHWDLQFLNERLFVEDTVSRLFGRHFLSIKNTPENAVKSVPCLLRQRKAYIYTAKGGYLKTTFVCKFCPSEPGLHLDYAFRSRYHTKIDLLTSM